MPIVPSGGASPFPSIGDVMRTARQRINDMHNDVNGDLLTDDAPYAQTLLTDAWTWIQDQAADAGVETNTSEITLYGLPARASQDVTEQCYVTWQGCSDGINQYDTPALPENLIIPMSIWRRPANNTSQGGMTLMKQAEDGLPRWFDPCVYDWRENGIYFYGTSSAQDMLIRFSAYFPDLDVTMPSNPVPIRGSKECLGSRIAFLFTNARTPGSPGASSLESLSLKAFADSLGTRTSKRKQRMTVRRRPFSFRYSGYSNPYPFVH